jgi:hypothetical protein
MPLFLFAGVQLRLGEGVTPVKRAADPEKHIPLIINYFSVNHFVHNSGTLSTTQVMAEADSN